MHHAVDEAPQTSQREEMLPLLKRHEIQVLRAAGHSQSEVARICEVSERAVRRIEQEQAVTHVDDAAERKRRGLGRPSKAEEWRGFVAEQLKAEPELMTLELLRRARLKGFDGSKTVFYAMVASMRQPQTKPVVRFEGVPGEFSQHDFGEVEVTFVDGARRKVHFFASRLKYSRWAEVSIVPDQRVESLVRALAQHFAAFRGVPLLAVFDRPKTVVLRWRKDGSVTDWNPTFAQAMLEMGPGIELCWPRRGNQKGAVEKLVGWVKSSFFKQRRFTDMDDLQRQLTEWLHEANRVRPSRATGEIPETRMAVEQQRLRPLKVNPESLALRFPVFVGPTGLVVHDKGVYSMPPDAIGTAGTLFLLPKQVRIVTGRFDIWHPRCAAGEKSIYPHHRAQAVAAVSGTRAKRYYKREQIIGLGNEAFEYLTELVHRRERCWSRDVDEMFVMLQRHGDEAMRDAIGRALSRRLFGAPYLRHFLSSAPKPASVTDVGTGAQSRGPLPSQLSLGLGRADAAGGEA